MSTRPATCRAAKALLISCFILLGALTATPLAVSSNHGSSTHAILAPPGNAPFTNIVIIAMENQNYADVMGTGTGSSNAPFIQTMLAQSATIPNYHSYGASSSINGCSAACYVAFTSGSTYGVSDGYGTITATNIIDRLVAAGLTWKAYCESGCPRGNDHFPFTAYSDIQNSPNIVTTSVDFTSSSNPVYAELNSASPPNYIWLTPTDSHNMHDNSIQTGDAYLQQVLVGSGTLSAPAPGSVLSTSLFTNAAYKTLLYIWWDEYDPSPNLLYGPMMNKAFVSSANNYDEYSSLHMIESYWGLPTLTSNDASAPTMSDLFRATCTTNCPMSTSFTVSTTTPVVNTAVVFTSTTSGGTTPYAISWSFGDGTSGTGASISHTFTSAQAFTVNETVTDSSSPSKTATSSNNVTVASSAPPGGPSGGSTGGSGGSCLFCGLFNLFSSRTGLLVIGGILGLVATLTLLTIRARANLKNEKRRLTRLDR